MQNVIFFWEICWQLFRNVIILLPLPGCLTAHCALPPRNVLCKIRWFWCLLSNLTFSFLPPPFIIYLYFHYGRWSDWWIWKGRYGKGSPKFRRTGTNCTEHEIMDKEKFVIKGWRYHWTERKVRLYKSAIRCISSGYGLAIPLSIL